MAADIEVDLSPEFIVTVRLVTEELRPKIWGHGPLEDTCSFVQSKILNQSPDHRLVGLRTADQRKDYPLTAEALHRLAQLTVVALAIQTEITANVHRSEEHTSELQSLMRISYAVFCLKQKTQPLIITTHLPTP